MARPSDAQTVYAPVVEPLTSVRSETALRVESRLQQSGYSSLRDVACDDCEGALRLRGSLPSHYLKQVALAAATAFAGERGIVNEIQVVIPRRRVLATPANAPNPRGGWAAEASCDFVDVAENIH